MQQPSSLSNCSRITWDGERKIQIQNLTREDEGLYGCSVSNPLGSDAEISPVLYTGNVHTQSPLDRLSDPEESLGLQSPSIPELR